MHFDFLTDWHTQHDLRAVANDFQFQASAVSEDGDESRQGLAVIAFKNPQRLVFVAANRDAIVARYWFELVCGNIRDEVAGFPNSDHLPFDAPCQNSLSRFLVAGSRCNYDQGPF